MKNGIKIASLGLAALLLFASCSAKDTPSDTAAGETQPNSQASDAAPREKAPDYADMIVGKVKSVVGNQVTLELGEIDKSSMPERPSGDAPDRDGGERPKDFTMPEGFSAPEGFTRPDGDSAPEGFTPPSGGSAPEGFSMPEGFSVPDGITPPDFSGEDDSGRSFGGMDIEVTYTGETAQYIIPAEVQVGRGDYTSLSEGMVIGITLDENNVVSAVRILKREAK